MNLNRLWSVPSGGVGFPKMQAILQGILLMCDNYGKTLTTQEKQTKIIRIHHLCLGITWY